MGDHLPSMTESSGNLLVVLFIPHVTQCGVFVMVYWVGMVY